jgi:hypothetical protein
MICELAVVGKKRQYDFMHRRPRTTYLLLLANPMILSNSAPFEEGEGLSLPRVACIGYLCSIHAFAFVARYSFGATWHLSLTIIMILYDN